jgi:hypothetical protein
VHRPHGGREAGDRPAFARHGDDLVGEVPCGRAAGALRLAAVDEGEIGRAKQTEGLRLARRRLQDCAQAGISRAVIL